MRLSWPRTVKVLAGVVVAGEVPAGVVTVTTRGGRLQQLGKVYQVYHVLYRVPYRT